MHCVKANGIYLSRAASITAFRRGRDFAASFPLTMADTAKRLPDFACTTPQMLRASFKYPVLM
jgi:hypothetical protein